MGKAMLHIFSFGKHLIVWKYCMVAALDELVYHNNESEHRQATYKVAKHFLYSDLELYKSTIVEIQSFKITKGEIYFTYCTV